MSFDHDQIAGLIRKLANADQLLAKTYISGTVFADDNRAAIDSLKKMGLLRTADTSDEYRLTGDLKRLIDRLLLRNQRYQQNINMAKMIVSVEEDIDDYRHALEQNNQDEAQHHLEQIDDTLYEAIEVLENSLGVMFAAITSQFGFVNSLNSKIRQNQRALAYAQQLVQELNHVRIDGCYDWLSNWSTIPPELSRKIIRFIDQYKSIVERLTGIVGRMKELLFKLRLQEQTANRCRAMAQFLRQHPEWEPLDWAAESDIPKLLQRAPGLPLQPGINTANQVLQADLAAIVHELRRQAKPITPLTRDSASSPLDTGAPEPVPYEQDPYESHIENLFALALEQPGRKVSALHYWRDQDLKVEAELWLDMVFVQYCCLPRSIRQTINLEMQGEYLAGFDGNQIIDEIQLQRVA